MAYSICGRVNTTSPPSSRSRARSSALSARMVTIRSTHAKSPSASSATPNRSPRGFLRQIKYELETNDHLQLVFDDIFYSNPARKRQKWDRRRGITVKRKANPKEATVEAHGLVDGQPTSKHFLHRMYDDVVTLESVTTPDMIAKTTSAYEMSDNLGTEGGTFALAGTRYHFADTYGDLMKRQAVKVRQHPCTRDATENFTPDNCVLMKPETLKAKRITKAPTPSERRCCSIPRATTARRLRRNGQVRSRGSDPRRAQHLSSATRQTKSGRPTTTRRSGSSGLVQTVTICSAISSATAPNLTERAQTLFDLHQMWKPLHVGYERYGMQADIAHIQSEMERRNYRFHITELGGQNPETRPHPPPDPLFEQGRVYIRRTRMHTDYEGVTRNLIESLSRKNTRHSPSCRTTTCWIVWPGSRIPTSRCCCAGRCRRTQPRHA